MSVAQFVNSLGNISRNEHVSRPRAMARHVLWQARKLAFPRPVYLPLSQSVITDDEPGGVISMINSMGMYDWNNMNFVKEVLGRAACFVDVGANIGAYTLIASETPSVRVIGLEPNPAAFAKLRRNVEMNHRANATLLNVAATRTPGTLRMTNDGASPINHVVGEAEAPDGTIEVRADTIDHICERLGVTPDLMKIDVEGHEPEVLAGAGRCLGGLLAVIVENGDRAEIVAALRGHGFKGPFHYRHGQKAFSQVRQRLPEDQIFVSARFREVFPEIVLPG